MDIPFLSLGISATAIVSGDYHTCVTTTGGHVKCWGLNSDGQLCLNSILNANAASPTPVNLTGDL
jgi:hypothetical protein